MLMLNAKKGLSALQLSRDQRFGLRNNKNTAMEDHFVHANPQSHDPGRSNRIAQPSNQSICLTSAPMEQISGIS